MSQEQGPDGGPDPAHPPWSAPDTAGDGGRTGPAAGVPTRTVPTPHPVHRPWRDGIPVRPLGVGELLDGTFSTIRRNPRATVGLGALLVALQQVLSLGAQLATNGLPTLAGVGDETVSIQTLVGGFGGITGVLVAAVIGAVITGMLVVVVSEDVLGHRVGAAEVWRRIRPRIWALLLASAISGILPYLGLLLILPGLILWALLALTTPALVLEDLGPFAALRRSAQLASPALLRVWCIRALSVLMGLLIQVLIALPFEVAAILVIAAGNGDPGRAAVVGFLSLRVLGEIAAGMITAPFLAGVLALLYIDRRMRAEGLDFVLRRHERLSGGPQSAPVSGPASGGPQSAPVSGPASIGSQSASVNGVASGGPQ
jgi:hypothetical protein